MGFFGLGGDDVKKAGDGLSSVIESTRFALTGDMPPEERVRLEELLVKLKEIDARVKEGVIQLANVDAKSSSRFQSGWRPMIGWVTGVSLAMYFIPQYAMGAYVWVSMINDMTHAEILAHGLPAYPVSSDAVMELVLAMLGMGAIRSADKFLGTAK